MTKPFQLKLAVEQDELARRRRVTQRARLENLDEQLAAALCRIEKTLGGVDVHKWLADELTDDEEHPVSVTQVYDWLARRNNRRPPAELCLVVCAADDEFAAWWSATTGYEAPVRLVRVPPEQQIASLKKALMEFGAAGEKKLRELQVLQSRGAP